MSCYTNTHVVGASWSRYFCQLLSCVFSLLVCWMPVQAQTTKQSITLSTAVTRTLNENPALKVYAFRQQELDGARSIANLPPGFELGFEVEDFADTVDEKDFEGTKLTLTLSSIVELGNKREARVSVVDSRYQQLKAIREVEALDLLGELTRRFVSVLTAQHRVELAKESAQLAEQARLEIEEQSSAGIVPLADLKRAEATVAQAHLTVKTEAGRLDYLKVALAAMWGSHSPAFESVEGDLFQLGEVITFEDLFAKLEQNPAIEFYATEERLRAAEQRLTSAKGSADLQWSAGVKHFYDLNDIALTAGISVPLFSSRRNQGASLAATAARDAVAVRREVALLDIRTRLFAAYSNRVQAMLTVKQLQDLIIPALAEALDETQKAYQQGRYRFLDYLSARKEWLAARLALIDAAAAALSYAAEIEQLTAEPLIAGNSSTDTKGISQ